MNVYDLLKIHRSLLKMMHDKDIKASDVCFIDVYEDFIEMRKTEKYSVTIAELSEKYGLSERTISRAMAKLQKVVSV